MIGQGLLLIAALLVGIRPRRESIAFDRHVEIPDRLLAVTGGQMGVASCGESGRVLRIEFDSLAKRRLRNEPCRTILPPTPRTRQSPGPLPQALRPIVPRRRPLRFRSIAVGSAHRTVHESGPAGGRSTRWPTGQA